MPVKKKKNIAGKKDKGFQVLQREILGILMIGFACLGTVILYTDNLGWAGEKIGLGLKILTGSGGIGLFLILALAGFMIMGRKNTAPLRRLAGWGLFWLSVEAFLHLGVSRGLTGAEMVALGKVGQGGGLLGALLVGFSVKVIGLGGSYVIFAVLFIIGLILALNRSFMEMLGKFGAALRRGIGLIGRQLKEFGRALQNEEPGQKKTASKNKNQAAAKTSSSIEEKADRTFTVVNRQDSFEPEESDGEQEARKPEKPQPQAEAQTNPAKPAEKITGTPLSRQIQYDGNFKLPPLSLLDKKMRRKGQPAEDLTESVQLLEETLNSFGVQAKVVCVTKGPAVMRYELQPASGVKVSKIVNLADDIALNLAASEVRIEAPIPGKSLVGIEVPNKEIGVVHFREVLESPEFQKESNLLTLALGKDITGRSIMADLSKMPHLLIAGATGSGKSVCINTIIASLVYRARPDQVKFLLIDPKMVEMTDYNGIPHLMAPVVTEAAKAASALKWIVREMEIRYELFAATGVRDIIRYNINAEEDEEKKPLPYVVVIIDELADLMMVAPGEVEEAICRLAQMARAAGIHLIVATQRPSVNVITGLIKANIPSRIAFAVSSQVDSRTILDMGGAEKLLGRGDMLYHPMGMSKPLRLQGCFLGDREVKNIVNYLQAQAQPEYQEIPIAPPVEKQEEDQEDELFYKAAQVFIENNTASVSLLQRKLRIGYTRAARLVDILEAKGVVGPYEGSKPREVLMSKGQFEQRFTQGKKE